MRENWQIETEDGHVTLALPRSFDADLDLYTSDGRVRLVDVFDGQGANTDDALRRTIGDGGYVLRVRSDDGSIRVEES